MMKLYAFSDFHLSGDPPSKPMDIFGAHWKNHREKIITAWLETIHEEDTVIMAGDLSWAMNMDDAISDFLGISAEGILREELELVIDAAMNEMSTLTLIQHFKKYAAGDVTPEMTDSVSGHFLAPERIGTPDIDTDFVPSAKRTKNCPSL